MKNSAPRISEAEWQVMKIFWQEPSASAQQVIEALTPVTEWSPATIKSLINRLLKKGALRFEKTGKSYRYWAAFAEQEFLKAESDSFLQRIFNGALSPMIAHFVADRKLSAAELAELEKLLKDNQSRPE